MGSYPQKYSLVDPNFHFLHLLQLTRLLLKQYGLLYGFNHLSVYSEYSSSSFFFSFLFLFFFFPLPLSFFFLASVNTTSILFAILRSSYPTSFPCSLILKFPPDFIHRYRLAYNTSNEAPTSVSRHFYSVDKRWYLFC